MKDAQRGSLTDVRFLHRTVLPLTHALMPPGTHTYDNELEILPTTSLEQRSDGILGRQRLPLHNALASCTS